MGGDAGNYQRLRALFDEAITKDPSALEIYLQRIQTDDPALHDTLRRLVDAHHQARSFLETPLRLTFPETLAGADFAATERFKPLRRLGAGGMGVVYEAEDLVRGEIVALKTLHQATPAGVYRLKQEFRSLAGIAHPNLVCLYELFVDDARCFFTMELVKGVNFVEYVRGGPGGALERDRVASALAQLVEGLTAVHQLRKLHRDIKPSNILVTSDGRVVILDFGLISELFADELGGAEHVIGGTPAYVPPEEGGATPPSEAGDWYAVGATLYEALTGQLPFSGPPLEVIMRKRQIDPPSPRDVSPEVPADLSTVCMGLLCRDPARRLSGREALGRLGRRLAGPHHAPPTPEPVSHTPFIGRRRELDVLGEAFRVAVSGRAAAVCVVGRSGIGKTALVRSFVARLAAHEDVTILAGRCFEHESVPYKALDGVVDRLSRFLMALPDAEVESVLPEEVAALPRLFPVMLRVPAIARICRERSPSISEPFLLRRLGFAVLRDLLGRIAARRHVVIFIDDLQWADVDGALLLEELLRPRDAPPVLAVMAFRSEEVSGNPFLRRLLGPNGADEWRYVHLERMPEAEAQELVSALLPRDSPLNEKQKERIRREASGSPFLLEQLTRYAEHSTVTPAAEPSFAEMFHERLATLSPEARHFLDALAICGRPMPTEIICAACGIARERQSLVVTLRSSRFIRSSGSSEHVETYHDRIREVLAELIVPAVAEDIHRRIVRALVESGSDDFEVLFEHYRGAGDAENASIQAGLAAAKAASALAFDRAAFFYDHALLLSSHSSFARTWREGLATALANAGRPGEAADAYLQAAAGAGQTERLELQRRGAEQLLIGGHIDRGLDLIRAMLADLAVSTPQSPRAALLSVLWRRARLRWRGLGFARRSAEEIDANTLRRLDTCWAATTGLLLVDIVAAVDFSARHLLMALDAGEPSRIARGMAIESVSWSAIPTGRRLSEKLARQSRSLAATIGNPHATALSLLADGIIACAAGEWRRALTSGEEALGILRDRCVGLTWETNIAQNVVIWALMYRGQLGELSRRVPALLADARSRGNLYIATELCTRSNFVWLAADQPDEGEREAIDSIGRWSQKGFHRQHYSAMLARVQTALYRGDAEAAWRLLAEHEPMLRRSLLTRVQVLRIESEYLRGRAALAMAAANRDSRDHLSAARAAARRIARERRRWSDPIALLLQAGIAHVEGSTRTSLSCLHDAAEGFERADMQLYLAVTRRRIGALQDDERGRALRRQAEDWMAEQHIKNPASITRMFSPGFPDEPVRLPES